MFAGHIAHDKGHARATAAHLYTFMQGSGHPCVGTAIVQLIFPTHEAATNAEMSRWQLLMVRGAAVSGKLCVEL